MGAVSDGQVENTVEASFALLELCLERLGKIAPVNRPEQLLELLPELAIQLTRLIMVELIKFDLAAAAQQRIERKLEYYWPAVGSVLPHEGIPLDLVIEEVQLRRAAGEHPRWDDYRQRFPDLANAIARLVANGDTKAFSGATTHVPELAVGTQVDDFFVLKQLGQGAFARVYLARQESMRRLVALKATSRGSEEPQALSQLDHANIVRVYDQREIVDPPTILLYMQYLAGGTLADCIQLVKATPRASRSGKLILDSIDKHLLDANQSAPEESIIRAQLADMNWPEVVAWIGIQLAEGLGYANQKGVLHRDIKPANILLSSEAIPKLADFNVSCSGLSGRAGAAAYFGGSLAYMSPEQLQVADPTEPKTADELDGRSDLYALGIVLWELWHGKRPWQIAELASNWTQAVQLQRAARDSEIQNDESSTNATERVLEKVLRSLLSVAPEDRPSSGHETAARLRLAFHPELAHRFEPAKSSLAGFLLGLPVLLVAAVIIFGPNTAASAFNYRYNQQWIWAMDPTSPNNVADVGRAMVESSATLIPNIGRDFEFISNVVNGIVFPLGGILFMMITWPIAKIVNNARAGRQSSPLEIRRLLNIGNQASLICGVLWTVSGVVFAVAFASWHRQFHAMDAFHFFISLVLCGGVAWIYPYFGMTLISLLIYYPKVIAPAMHDPHYAEHCRRIRTHMRWYLLSAAAIPLLAVALLVLRNDMREIYVVSGVCTTGIGLLASFYAYQKLDDTMVELAKVLGDQRRRLTV